MDTVPGCSKTLFLRVVIIHLSIFVFLFFFISSVHLSEVTTHVFLSLRADEIEILMTDLERANQVARSV